MKIREVLLTVLFLASAATHAQYLADNARRSGVEGMYQEGEKAYRSGDHAKAIILFGAVLEQDADHLNAYLQRGSCHILTGSYDKAVADLTAVIERKSDHIWAITSRGSAYNKLGKYELAIADFNRVIELEPKNEEAYNNRGWAQKATGDHAAACKDWKTSKQLGNAEARIILTNNRCK